MSTAKLAEQRKELITTLKSSYDSLSAMKVRWGREGEGEGEEKYFRESERMRWRVFAIGDETERETVDHRGGSKDN